MFGEAFMFTNMEYDSLVTQGTFLFCANVKPREFELSRHAAMAGWDGWVVMCWPPVAIA